MPSASPAAAPAAPPASAATATPPPSAAVTAEDAVARLPRVDLVGGGGVAAFELQGDVQKVDLTPIAVTGQPFTDAVRVAIKEGSGHEWAVQLHALNSAAIAAGDAILVTFYLRTETPQEGGVGETEFVFELNGSPYTKSVNQITAGFWDRFYQGPYGRLQFGLQYSYTQRAAFADANGLGPKATENMLFTSFRYYPF